MEVIRYDSLNLDANKITKTKEGYLKGSVIATRTGVFTYVRSDGSTQKELRTANEVFNKDAIESFKMLPVTNGHPKEEVTSENAKGLAVGYTGENVKQDESFLVTNIKITDKTTIKEIENGKNGLSYGYKVTLVEKEGIYKGERYDCMQTNIRGNHLAVVHNGRAGIEARLRLDGQGAVCVFDNFNNDNFNMKTLKIGDNNFEVPNEVFEEFNLLKKEIETIKGKIDPLEGERDSLKNKVDGMVKTMKTKNDNSELDTKVKEGVKSRMILISKSASFLKEDKGIDDLSDMEIKVKVIKSFDPEFKEDEKSEEYVNARFDSYLSIKEDIAKIATNKILDSKNDVREIKDMNEDLQMKLIQRANNKFIKNGNN